VKISSRVQFHIVVFLLCFAWLYGTLPPPSPGADENASSFGFQSLLFLHAGFISALITFFFAGFAWMIWERLNRKP